ncbi:MAG: ABC transporter permease [Cyclobacteriaceae bacterium]
MLRNYIKIAFRNLLKHKVFSFINIAGLALGIACCTLLALYIRDEFSYEKHFAGHERIYRVNTVFTRDGNEQSFPRTAPAIAMDMLRELPELESATRVVPIPEIDQHLVRHNQDVFYEKNGYLVDSTFLDVFPFELKEGDPNTALDAPASVLLTEKLAAKIFGDQSPLDELLIINSGWSTDTFHVTGVIKDTRKRTHLDGAFYMSLNSRGWGREISGMNTWAWNNFMMSYIKLKPGATWQSVEDKLPAMMESKAGELLKNAGLKKRLYLQALDDIHLYSKFTNQFGMSDNGNIQYVYVLSTIGIFILLIACINFMNLTTAKASQRAGEVGVRKSLGATRSNLIRQFLGESMTIVTAAMILAIGLVQIALPFFNSIAQKELTLTTENIGYVLISLVGVALITGLVAGSYPAFFLSAFQPATVLKDKRLSGGSSNFLRRSLVVFQFIISITLISSIVIIQKQLNFIQNKPLGFETENKIMIPLRTEEAKSKYTQLKNAAAQLASVTSVSGTTSLPSTPLLRDFAVYPQGSSFDKAVLHRNMYVDENYFKTLNIKLLAGREMIYETDSMSWENRNRKVIVNQMSLKELGIDPENAVGSILFTEFEGEVYKHEIVGVVEDFHQFSLHQAMAPLLFMMAAQPEVHNFLVVSSDVKNAQGVVSQLEKSWKELIPNTPFESGYLTDSVAKQYETDTRTSTILSIATVLAIFISCLGLYGLSIFVAERKVKEIGIRKVMGASVTGIVALLSKEFVKLVIIAFVIAVPVGYYGMNSWLAGFAYKIELNAVVFVIAGVISLLIAWLTISFESIKAAVSNPVKSLRNE